MESFYGNFDNNRIRAFFSALYSDHRDDIINLKGFKQAAKNSLSSNQDLEELGDDITYYDYLRMVLVDSKQMMKELKAATGTSNYNEKILHLKDFLDKLYKLLGEEPELKEPVKLKWIASKTNLYQLFYQIFHTNDDDVEEGVGIEKIKLTSNTLPELAEFIKIHVEGFEETSIESIIRQIQKNETDKKHINIKLTYVESIKY